MGRCRLCEMKQEGGLDYCTFHLGALRNLKEAYEVWRKALKINWKEFLGQASKRPEMGQRTKEVAISHLSEGREA